MAKIIETGVSRVALAVGGSAADAVPVDASNPLPVDVQSLAQSSMPAGTDRSGAITLGGTAQVLAAANTSRKSLTVQNISVADIWVNEIGGTAAVDTAGSWKIAAGGAFAVSTNRAISIIGATTGQKFTATET